MAIDTEKRYKEINNSLIGLRMRHLDTYYKVQFALVTGTIVILLGFYSKIHHLTAVILLRLSLAGLGAATITQMLIHLNIYLSMHRVWYEWDKQPSAGKPFYFLFIVNVLVTILGLVTGYVFLIKNV